MKNNRNHSLYICIEILSVVIASIIGFLMYNLISDIEPEIYNFVIRFVLALTTAIGWYVVFRLCIRIVFDD